MDLQDVRLPSSVSNKSSNETDAAESDTVLTAKAIDDEWIKLSIREGDEEIDQLSKSLLEAVASREGNRVECIREILERGGDLNKRHGGKKRTLLHELLRRYRPDSPVDDDVVAEDLASELRPRSCIKVEAHVMSCVSSCAVVAVFWL